MRKKRAKNEKIIALEKCKRMKNMLSLLDLFSNLYFFCNGLYSKGTAGAISIENSAFPRKNVTKAAFSFTTLCVR